MNFWKMNLVIEKCNLKILNQHLETGIIKEKQCIMEIAKPI